MSKVSVWDEFRVITGAEKAILKLANIPEFQWYEADLIPDECDVEAFKKLKYLRENIDNFDTCMDNNLLICGKHLGCGKTEWALKLMLTYIENNAYKLDYVDEGEVSKFNIAYFCKVVPFLVRMKQFGNNKKISETFDRISNSDLVVFDDISALPMSNYDYSTLYALVEERLWKGLPTIYTTNIITQEELTKTLGERLAERIWKTSKIVELKGEGYRGE